MMKEKLKDFIKTLQKVKVDIKKVIPIVILLMFSTKTFTGVAYASVIDGVSNILDTAISFFIRLFADVLYELFFDTGANSIDKIVYNQGGYNGLTLTKGNDLANFFFQFYLFFHYIAIVFFVPIGMWFTIAFVRAGENAQRKAEFKEKGLRLFVTFIWLTSMPQILEWLFIINNAFVNAFFIIVRDVIGNSDLLKDGLILGYMKQLAHETKTTVHAIAYIVTVFINLWMIFYYFIRDITISFLFMIFPLIAVFYPLKKGAVMNWWKEMFSNIITQTIHALILTTVVAMAFYLKPQNGQSMDFTSAMYILTAFCMVIPFTSIIKSMLGFEGSLGGAKSLAGIGAMYGAFRLGSMGIGGLKQGLGRLKSGITEGIDATSDYLTLKKKGKEDPLTGQLTAINRKGEKITMDDVISRAKKAGKDTLKGSGSTFAGLTAGLGTTAGTMAFGNATTALMLGAGASYIGSKVGSGIGGGMANTLGGMKGGVDMINFARLHQSEKDKALGLTSPILQNTDYKKKEQRALVAEKMFKTFGMERLGNLSHAILSNKELSNEELESIKDLEMYVDKEQSVLYGTDANGSKKILRTGKGDPTVKTPYTRKATFNNGELALSDSRKEVLISKAEELAHKEIGETILDERVERALVERGIEKGSDEWNELYGELTGGALLDSSSKYFDKDLYKQFNQIKNNNFNKLEKAELSQMKSMREKLGVKGLSFEGDSQAFTGTHKLFDTQLEIMAMENKSIDNLKKVQEWEGIISEQEKNGLNGVGYALTSKNGTTYYKVEADGSRKAIGYGSANNNLKGTQMEMTPVKFNNGEILLDQVKYALEGTGFNTVSPSESEVFADAEMRLGKDIMSQIKPNSQIMVTVEYDKNSKTGQYGVYDISSGNFLGNSPMPESYAQGGNDINGTVYHIQVDALGKLNQQGGSHFMTDVDFHNAYSIQGTRFNNIPNAPAHVLQMKEYELNKKRFEREQIQDILSSLYNNDTIHNAYISSIQ